MPTETSIQKFLQSALSFYVAIVGGVAAVIISSCATYYGLSEKFAVLDERVMTHIQMTADFGSRLAGAETDIAVLYANQCCE